MSWRNLLPASWRGLARGARFALRNARFRPYVVTKNLDGVRFEFLIGDWVGETWYAPIHSLSTELRFLRDRIIRPGDVVLEAGAHHGFLTILFARWIGPTGRVVAVEASPRSAAVLRENVVRNQLGDRVRVVAGAVAARHGIVSLSRDSNAVPIVGSSLGALQVDAVTLDDFADSAPTVVKLDVEGSEIEALKGGAQVLRRRPRLAIEVHVEPLRLYGQRPAALFEFVEGLDYDWWIQPGGDVSPRPYAGENLEDLPIEQLHVYGIPRTVARKVGSAFRRPSRHE